MSSLKKSETPEAKSSTIEFKRKLIMQVKKHPSIWKKTYMEKQEAWIAIEKEMGSLGTLKELQTSWTALRSAYFRKIFIRTIERNFEAPEWRYFHDMSFLYEYVKEIIQYKLGGISPPLFKPRPNPDGSQSPRCPCCVYVGPDLNSELGMNSVEINHDDELENITPSETSFENYQEATDSVDFETVNSICFSGARGSESQSSVMTNSTAPHQTETKNSSLIHSSTQDIVNDKTLEVIDLIDDTSNEPPSSQFLQKSLENAMINYSSSDIKSRSLPGNYAVLTNSSGQPVFNELTSLFVINDSSTITQPQSHAMPQTQFTGHSETTTEATFLLSDKSNSSDKVHNSNKKNTTRSDISVHKHRYIERSRIIEAIKANPATYLNTTKKKTECIRAWNRVAEAVKDIPLASIKNRWRVIKMRYLKELVYEYYSNGMNKSVWESFEQLEFLRPYMQKDIDEIHRTRMNMQDAVRKRTEESLNGIKSAVEPAPGPESKPDRQTPPQPQSQPQQLQLPQPQSQPQQLLLPQPQLKPQPQHQPQLPQPQSQPQQLLLPQPQHQPQLPSKTQQEHQPLPLPQPQHQSHPRPRQQLQPQTQPQPQPQPQTQPHPQPQPQLQPQPQPQPQPNKKKVIGDGANAVSKLVQSNVGQSTHDQSQFLNRDQNIVAYVNTNQSIQITSVETVRRVNPVRTYYKKLKPIAKPVVVDANTVPMLQNRHIKMSVMPVYPSLDLTNEDEDKGDSNENAEAPPPPKKLRKSTDDEEIDTNVFANQTPKRLPPPKKLRNSTGSENNDTNGLANEVPKRLPPAKKFRKSKGSENNETSVPANETTKKLPSPSVPSLTLGLTADEATKKHPVPVRVDWLKRLQPLKPQKVFPPLDLTLDDDLPEAVSIPELKKNATSKFQQVFEDEFVNTNNVFPILDLTTDEDKDETKNSSKKHEIACLGANENGKGDENVICLDDDSVGSYEELIVYVAQENKS